MNYLKSLLKPPYHKLFNKIRPRYAKISYSQEGEDILLSRIFNDKKNGFYVDVGAHHPERFSNTYYFYLQGWNGINIDAMPNSINLFNKLRPRDINLELAISSEKQKLTYYMFNEPALNGFSKTLSESRDDGQNYKIIKTQEIKTFTLAEVLDQWLTKDIQIDFMSIDVEGLDYQILQSNNWEKYHPTVVLVEEIDNFNLKMTENSQIVSFMLSKGYEFYCKLFYTLIFIDNKFI